jgi:hypothetical protein
MTRSRNPSRIYAAQRAGVLARLIRNERVGELEADRLIALWERSADEAGRDRGSNTYWDDAWTWIDEERRRPADKTDMSAVGDDGQVFGG